MALSVSLGGISASIGGDGTGGLGIGASIGGSQGVNANASLGGGGGLGVGATVGGAQGVNASVGAAAGTGIGVDASVGGASGVNANVGLGGTTGVTASVTLGGTSSPSTSGGSTSGGSTSGTGMVFPVSMPTEAEYTAAREAICSLSGNSEAYNGRILFDQNGQPIGVIHAAWVSPELMPGRIAFATLDRFEKPQQCITISVKSVEIGRNGLRLPVTGAQLRAMLPRPGTGA